MLKRVNIDGSKLNNSSRRLKASSVATEMLQIMTSNLFKKKIFEMDRDKWLKGESSSSRFKNMDNTAIYYFFMEGREEWNQELDYEADLLVDDYWSLKRVIGYMNPGKPTIWVNTRYFDSNSKKLVGSNFIHEWAHTLGARHSGNYYRNSLPYYLNEVYEGCHDHLITNKLPDIEYMSQDPKEIYLPAVRIPYEIECRRVWWKLWLGSECYKVEDVL